MGIHTGTVGCMVHLPCAAIPEDVAHSNPNLVLVTTRRGGHIGFMDGLIPIRKNLMDRVLMQFARAVFEREALQSIRQQ